MIRKLLSSRASSETQEQLVGTIDVRGESLPQELEEPGHLLLSNQFQKRSNSLHLIGHKKSPKRSNLLTLIFSYTR